MQNLREKLLKAGLINEADAKKSETEKAKESARPQEARAPRSGGGGAIGGRPERSGRPDRGGDRRPGGGAGADRRGAGGGGDRRPGGGGGRPQRSAAPIPKLPPLALPNNKEFQRLEAKKQLELDRRIRDLVLTHQVAVDPGEQTFYFVTRKNRLRRLELTPAQAQLLETGKLAVVERPEPSQIEHGLVPAEIAEEILKLQARSVRFFNKGDQPVGFLTDDDLQRRQKVEADRVSRGDTDSGDRSEEAAEDGSESPIVDPRHSRPEEEGEGVEPEETNAPPSESLAEQAEKISTRVPVSDEDTGS